MVIPDLIKHGVDKKNELDLSSLESINKHHNESAKDLEKIFKPFLDKLMNEKKISIRK